jgi:hypothetical protein
MPDLSPAAQAMLNAYSKHVSEWLKSSKTDKPSSHYHASGIAAALRAAADEVVPMSYEDIWTDGRMLQYEKQDPVRDKLRAIADELEAA